MKSNALWGGGLASDLPFFSSQTGADDGLKGVPVSGYEGTFFGKYNFFTAHEYLLEKMKRPRAIKKAPRP